MNNRRYVWIFVSFCFENDFCLQFLADFVFQASDAKCADKNIYLKTTLDK